MKCYFKATVLTNTFDSIFCWYCCYFYYKCTTLSTSFTENSLKSSLHVTEWDFIRRGVTSLMEKFTLSRIFEAVDRCCSWFDASLAYQGLSAGFPELVMNTKLRANVAFWQGRVNSKYKLLEAPYPPSYSLWAFLQKAEITIQENTWKRFISAWVWSIIAQSDISVNHSALGFIDQSIRQSTFDDRTFVQPVFWMKSDVEKHFSQLSDFMLHVSLLFSFMWIQSTVCKQQQQLIMLYAATLDTVRTS